MTLIPEESTEIPLAALANTPVLLATIPLFGTTLRVGVDPSPEADPEIPFATAKLAT